MVFAGDTCVQRVMRVRSRESGGNKAKVMVKAGAVVGERGGGVAVSGGVKAGGGETPHRKGEKKGGCSDGHALEQMNVGSCLGCRKK